VEMVSVFLQEKATYQRWITLTIGINFNFEIKKRHTLVPSLMESDLETKIFNRPRYRRHAELTEDTRNKIWKMWERLGAKGKTKSKKKWHDRKIMNEDTDNKIWKMWKKSREKRKTQRKNKLRDNKERITTRLMMESRPAHHNIKKQEEMHKAMLRKILKIDITNKQLDKMRTDHYNKMRKRREFVVTLRKRRRKNAPNSKKIIKEKSKFEENKKNEKNKNSNSKKKNENQKLDKSKNIVINEKEIGCKEEVVKKLERNCKPQNCIKGNWRSREHVQPLQTNSRHAVKCGSGQHTQVPQLDNKFQL
ncbi:hypothetical protein L9F63_000575, partial [Diploptera punctata]